MATSEMNIVALRTQIHSVLYSICFGKYGFPVFLSEIIISECSFIPSWKRNILAFKLMLFVGVVTIILKYDSIKSGSHSIVMTIYIRLSLMPIKIL